MCSPVMVTGSAPSRSARRSVRATRAFASSPRRAKAVVSTKTASHSACRRAVIRRAARTSRSESGPSLTHTMMRSVTAQVPLTACARM